MWNVVKNVKNVKMWNVQVPGAQLFAFKYNNKLVDKNRGGGGGSDEKEQDKT